MKRKIWIIILGVATLFNVAIMILLKNNNLHVVQTSIATMFYSKDKLNDINTDEFYNNFLNAVEENKKINKKTKMFFYDSYYKNIIKEYGKYMDQEKVLSNIRTLSIVYKEDINPQYIAKNENIGGQYKAQENTIYMLRMNSYDEYEKQNALIFKHETNHVFQNSNSYNFSGTLYEGITEIIRLKYDQESFSEEVYIKEKKIVYMLEKIIGKEPLLRMYFSGDTTGVIVALKNIQGTTKNALKFIDNIDNIHDSYSIAYTQEIETKNYRTVVNKFKKDYQKYYQKKYQTSFNENEFKL